jgi:hypothetical protein
VFVFHAPVSFRNTTSRMRSRATAPPPTGAALAVEQRCVSLGSISIAVGLRLDRGAPSRGRRAVSAGRLRSGARVIVNSSRSVEEGEMLARSLPEAVYVQGDVSREEDGE